MQYHVIIATPSASPIATLIEASSPTEALALVSARSRAATMLADPQAVVTIVAVTA